MLNPLYPKRIHKIITDNLSRSMLEIDFFSSMALLRIDMELDVMDIGFSLDELLQDSR